MRSCMHRASGPSSPRSLHATRAWCDGDDDDDDGGDDDDDGGDDDDDDDDGDDRFSLEKQQKSHPSTQ